MMHVLLFALLGMELRYLSTTPEPPSPGFGMSVLYRDKFCYVPTYAGFEILNIADPDSILVVSSQTTPGYTRHMDLAYPYLYVADDYDGLVVADVSDPARPSIVGHCSDMMGAWGVGHYGSYAYVGDYYEGLVVLDASDPALPVRVGAVPTGRPGWGLAVSYPYLYLASHSEAPHVGGVYVVDISDPAAPVLVDSVVETYFACGSVVIRDSILYACSMLGGLVLYDISQPDTLVELSSYQPPGNAPVYGIALRPGDTLAFPSIYTKGMAVLNVADPTHPVELSTFRHASGQVYGIGVSGNRVHMLQADPYAGLVDVDVSDPENPTYVMSVTSGEFYLWPVVRDSLVFLTRRRSGVDIYSLANPLVPRKVGWVPSQTEGAAVRGGLLYCGNPSPGALDVYDVSDPENPQLVSSCDTFIPYTNLVVRGDHLYYVGGLRHYGYDWVVAVDISDSTMPCLAGECAYSGGNYAIALDPSRPYLYATRYMMLEVYDITDPLVPAQVAQCSLRGSATGITVQGQLAYVADYTEGLTVVDVSNPLQPHIAGWYKDPDHNEMIDVAVIRNAAVLCNGDRGVWLLDVTDPADIKLEDTYDTPSSAERLCAFQDSLIALSDLSAVLFFGVQGLGIVEERSGGGAIGSPTGLLVTPTCGGGRFSITSGAPDRGALAAQIRTADGRVVDTLHELAGIRGRHSWLWDVSGREQAVPAGVYFITVGTETGHQTARAVVVR